MTKIRRRLGHLAVALFLLGGCAPGVPPSRTLYRGAERGTLLVAGNVRQVLKGEVSKNSLAQVDTGRFSFAVGGGTFSLVEHMGEGIVINGRGYVKISDDRRSYPAMSGNRLQTPFLMGVTRESLPGEIMKVGEKTRVEELYRRIAAKYDAFAVVGVGMFAELHTTALKKAPIYNEPITAPRNRSRYFHPLTKITDTPAILVGVVHSSASGRIPPELRERMFYNNFADKSQGGSVAGHTHVAVTDRYSMAPPFDNGSSVLSQISSAQVRDVRHLLGQSVMQHGLLLIYPLDKIESYR